MTKALRNGGKRASKVIADLDDRGGEVKILILDIETLPNKGYMWGLFDQNFGLSQVIEWSQVASFAAKWYGEKKIHFYSDFHNGHDEMVKAGWDLFNEADIIVHYNGKAFDVKHMHREFLLAGLGPPSPHRDIDLLTAVRSAFKFTSNKLDSVSQRLGVGSKVKHDGFDLWVGCMQDDPKAWAKMKKYNIGDITITEAVYEKVRPWVKNHPHVGMYTGNIDNCPKCDSAHRQRRGHYRTNACTYAKFQCQSCMGYYRSKNRIPDMTSSTRNV